MQGQESDDWWDIISSDCSSEDDEPAVIRQHISADFVPFAPKLYRVGLGMGYLELPQVSCIIIQNMIYLDNKNGFFFVFVISNSKHYRLK